MNYDVCMDDLKSNEIFRKNLFCRVSMFHWWRDDGIGVWKTGEHRCKEGPQSKSSRQQGEPSPSSQALGAALAFSVPQEKYSP